MRERECRCVISTWWKMSAWLMEPQVVGRERKCSRMTKQNMIARAMEVYIGSMRKHMIIQPSMPIEQVCQEKNTNVGLWNN